MTDHTSTPTHNSDNESADSVAAQASAAKDTAVDAAQTGKQAAGEVAQTAATAAKDVAQETKSQARQLAGKTGDQLTEQADVQKNALVDGLHSLVEQLDAMTGNVDGVAKEGVAVEAATKIRDAARGAADWLDGRDPGGVLEGIREFGRERPGAYLGGSFLAGVLAGRLTRGAVAVHTDDGTGSQSGSHTPPQPSRTASAPLDDEPSPTVPTGTGRHQESYVNSAPGLYSDTAISSRPSPGTTA